MSEAEPVENGVAEEEFVDANEDAEPKKVGGEEGGQSEEPAVNGVVTEEDRTEDQVPDITGTEENVADPMTTSMDGIEDLPKEDGAAEEGAEIQVEKFEDAPENAEEPAAEEAPAEPAAEEAPAEEVEQEATEVPAEGDGEFKLQDPPSPKRERTANELDEAVEEREPTPAVVSGQASAVGSQPQTPRSASAPKTPGASGGEEEAAQESQPEGGEESQPEGGESNVQSQAQSQAASQAGSQPGTPRPGSEAASQPQTPRSRVEGSVPGTPKASEPATPRSRVEGSVPGTPKVSEPAGSTPGTPKASNAGSAAQTPRTAASNKAFDFEENASAPRSPRTPRSDAPKTPSVADEAPKTPSEAPKSPSVVEERSQAEEPPAEDAPAEEPVEKIEDTPAEEPVEKTDEAPAETEAPKEETEEPRRTSTSPPPRHRAQSPSPPARREPRDLSGTDYTPYDQDSHKETVPTRVPPATSFSSWNPPERESYKPISPWVTSSGSKYSDYTPTSTYRPSSHYTSIFDDQVSAGPFSQSLYSTNRLLERSRSRSRTRQKALRHSSFQRYASQLPSPFRSGEYAPRSSSLSRGLTRPYTSFTSFLDYSGAKNYELGRAGSRGSIYDSTQALSRANSNVDYFLGAGRISRVDSFVNNLNSRYEWQVPAAYELYRSSSRDQIGYAPLNQYNSYTNVSNSFNDWTNERRRRSREITPVQWKSSYETQIGELQRSLSRERFVHDSLKNKYSKVSYQLEQACKQMDLLRANSYSSLNTGHQPRTSVYASFYPYY